MNKKYLSQNWLNDQEALDAMVEAGEVDSTDTVLEIGPGPGALTKKLVKSAKKVVAVEFDAVLAANLAESVPADNLEVHHHDILTFDHTDLPVGYKIVANIPYHITAKIIHKFINSDNKPSIMTLLVQKEVAQRVISIPGKMSILSVSVQLYAETKALMVVPAEMFTPPPKVDSQILQLKIRDNPLYDLDEKRFFRIVKAGFGERRKLLLNSLSGGLQITKSEVSDLLELAKVPLTSRAQELSIDMWYTLYTKYEELYN